MRELLEIQRRLSGDLESKIIANNEKQCVLARPPSNLPAKSNQRRSSSASKGGAAILGNY